MMNITQALNIREGEIISFVGGGGKTTFIRLISRELKKQGRKSLVTTTTHMYPEGCTIADDNEDRLYSILMNIPDKYFPVMCGYNIDRNGKLSGLSNEFIKRLKESGAFPYILIEADGSKGKSIKAFGSHEPVVPDSTTLYIAVTGLDCIGKTLDCDNAHRAEVISSITGLPINSIINEDTIIELFRSSRGLLRGRSENSRKIVILNKADDSETLERGCKIGERILKECTAVERVLVCSNFMDKSFCKVMER